MLTTRNGDGTYDIVQRGHLAAALPPADLERLYWAEVRASTLGLVAFSRDAIRVLGIWPRLIAFERGGGARRRIAGGVLVRRGGGSVRWDARDGEVTVAVEGFAPSLPAPLFRFELWFHARVGDRYLARLVRATASA